MKLTRIFGRRVYNWLQIKLALYRGYDSYEDYDGKLKYARSIAAGEVARLPIEHIERIRMGRD